MSTIRIVCPGCHKRFSVSERFAGQTGPCPNCKTEIKIPGKGEEVKVHDPSKIKLGDKAGRHALPKPILREEVVFDPTIAGWIAGAVVAVLLVTWVLGWANLFQNPLIVAIGLLLVTPPLVIAGYWFLRSQDELLPYRGKSLYLRAGLCSLIYAALWGVFVYVSDLALTGDLWTWAFVAPPFFVAGAFVPLLCFDFEFGNGFFHYCFYVFVTVLLRALAGLGWVWVIAEKAGGPPIVPPG